MKIQQLAALTSVALAAMTLGCSSNKADPTEPTAKGTVDPGGGPPKLALDQCGLKTAYVGDENCILPPPPDKGFQVHIGPNGLRQPRRGVPAPAGGRED